MRNVLQNALLIGLLSFSGHVTVQSFLPVNQKLGPVATSTKYSAPDLQKHVWSAGHRNSDASLYAVTASKEDSIVKDFMGKNKLEFFKLAIIALVATVSAVSVPLYFSKVLDALTSPIFDIKRLMRPLSMMLLCHVVEPIMTIFYVRKCSLLIDIFVSNLRMAVYSNILRRDVSTFELNSPMSSSQLVTGEIDKIKVSAMSNISRDRGLRSVLELLSGLGILYTLCLPLALFFSTIIPMTAFVTSRFADGLFVAAASESKATTQQANRAIETISNFKEVYSFSNQPLEEKRFQEMQSVASGTALKTGLAKALFEAANRAGIYFNILSLFAVGGLLVQRKAVLPTVLVSFIGYCFSLNFATQGLLFSFGDLRSASASWQKIQNFLKETASPPSSAHHTAAVSMDTAAPLGDESHRSISDSQAAEHTMDISFKGVSFSYKNRPDVVVLNNIDLSIPRGKMTALVGPSGAGKSTIAALLNRFYQPSSGTLSVNGVNSEDISAEEYLQHVSVVRQSPALFTDTVANNIAYGASAYRDISRAEIVQSAKAANAHSFIISLPEGYDTVLGEGTGFSQLSGGQKQRVAIARALLKNAPLLVLDEATSALDSESEALVQDALDKLIKGRTTVVIAHRLSTVIKADQIAVVKDGTIAETGKHEDLMDKRGYYFNLMSTQMSAYDVNKDQIIS